MVTLFQEFMGKVLSAPSPINQLKDKLSGLTEGFRDFARKSQPQINTTAIKQAIQSDFNTFWRSNVGDALVRSQRFIENAPRFTFADQQRSLPARFLYGIPQTILNVPSDILTSGARLGKDLREGKLTDPRALISDLSGAALPLATIGSFGVGPSLARSGIQALGRGLLDQSFKNFLKQSAKVGAGYGGTFSMLESLKQNRFAPDLQDQLTEGFQSFLVGAGLGAGLGVAVPLGLKGAGRVASELVQRPGLRSGFAKIPGEAILNRSKPIKTAEGKYGYIVDKGGGVHEPVYLDQPIEEIEKQVIKNRFPSSTLQESADQLKKIQDPLMTAETFGNVIKKAEIKQKVNVWDLFKTPNRVLSKMGLGEEAVLLRQKYDDYLVQLPKEIDKITTWSKQVPAESNSRIFDYLDGKKINLDTSELKVAGEIKSYLADWATKLKLPKDRQISKYISHIFPKGMIEKEFDPDLAKLIQRNVSGSVYDPFLQRRVGKPDFIRDTWQALDAYTKRAVRKYHMDQALEQISKKAESLPLENWNYVKDKIARINMQPTMVDTWIDNAIKSSPVGYRLGQRPFTAVSQSARQAVFRGLIGLNPAVALRNIQQSTNTYALVGEKNFGIGLLKTIQNLPRYVLNQRTELDDLGILGKDIVQDRTLNATRKFWQYTDDVLFYLFNLAEKWNRSISYFAGKAQALSKGMDEQAAINFGKQLTGKTQFFYDVIDTPAALSSDLMRTLFQFGKYPLAQTEFLVEMVGEKNIAGSVRWIASNLLFVATVGKILGLEPWDMFPQFRFGIPPTLQLPVGVAKGVIESRDEFGNELSLKDRILNKDIVRGIMNYVPAGGQIRKTFTGLEAAGEQGSYTESGKLRFPVGDKLQAGLFGQYAGEAAKDYYSQNLKPLSDLETRQFQFLTGVGIEPSAAYERIRESQKADDQFKRSIEGKKEFNWFGLFNRAKEVSATTATPTLTGDPLIDAMTAEKQLDERQARTREVFNLGLPKEQTEKILQTNGLGTYEEASVVAIKSLGIESGARPEYLKKVLLGLDHDSYLRTVYELAEKEILTTGVTAYWLDQGDITYDQKKAMDRIISATKGKISTGGSRRLKLPSVPGGAVTIRKVALPRRPKIKVPKIKLPENKLTPKKLTPPKIQLLKYRKGGTYDTSK